MELTDCPYSPECVEVEFSELRLNGVLRSSPLAPLSGIMITSVSDESKGRGRVGEEVMAP